MSKRYGTSRRIHHCTDHLDDSLDATMQIERMVEEHGPAWAISMLAAMTKSSDQSGIREIVQRITSEGRE